MKCSIQVDDTLYNKFLDKVIEEDTTVKKVLINAIQDFVNSKPKQSYTHKADYLITELALQAIEARLSSLKTSPQYQISDYPVISELCLTLLPLINSPQCRLLEQEFHQDDALTIINSRLYHHTKK